MSLKSPIKRALASGRALREHTRLQPSPALDEFPGAQRIERSGRLPSVLCIHGFGGVPQEVAMGCEIASELGLQAVAPVLAGHGTIPAQVADVTFEDWLEGARTDFDQLRRQGPVIVVGLSLGAVIASALALSAPGDVAGLCLLANAFWLNQPVPGAALQLAQRFRLPNFSIPKASADLADPEGQQGHLTYDLQPLHAAIQVLRAGQTFRQELFRIHCPTLIVHGAHDRVCPVSNAWRAAEAMSEIEPRVVILPHSRHIITRDYDRSTLRRELREFLQEIRSAVASA